MTVIIICLIFSVIITVTVVALDINRIKKSKEVSGFIVLSDEGLYLSLSKEDTKILEKSDTVNIRVIRRNFSGFNE